MKMYLGKNKLLIYMIISYFIALLPRLYLAFTSVTICNVSDNVSLLSTAAYFAGYDWGDVISNAGYYGFGYYSLFFWIYHITDNPIIIYRLFAVVSALSQATIAPLSIILWIKYFNIKDYRTTLVISMICSYFVGVRTGHVYNEHPLTMCVWLLAICMCKLVDAEESPKKKMGYSLLVVLLIGYCMTLHTRTLSIIIALVMACILYAIRYGKVIFSWYILPIGVVVYLGCNQMIIYMQQAIWSANESAQLRNATVSMPKPKGDTIPAIIDVVLGQINSFMIFGMGLITFTVIVLVIFLSKKFFVREKIEQKSTDDTTFEKKIFLVGSTMLITFGGTVLSQALSWGPGIADGNWYSYKACFYLRYAMPYVGIIVLCGLAICVKYREYVNKSLYLSVFASVIFLLYLIKYIIPKVADNVVCATAGMGALLGRKNADAINISNYYRMLVIYLGVFLCCVLLVKIKKERIALVFVCIALIYQYYFLAEYQDKYTQNNNYTVVNASYQMYEEWKNQGIEFPDSVYVVEGRNISDHQNFYLYQFFFFDKKIIPEKPDLSQEDILLFTDKEIPDIDCYEYRLDENEIVYAKGKYAEGLQSWISNKE